MSNCNVRIDHCVSVLIAQTEDEVSCRADERVHVTNDMGDGWLQVVKANGSSGYIPESYVEYV